MKKRQEIASLSTRDRILRTAGDLFARHGFDGVSVRDIVAAARVNLGAITYHFGSKETLFGEVVESKVAPLLRMGEEIAAGDDPPERKIRAIMERYAFYVLHEEPALRVLFSEMMLGGTRLPKAAEEGIRWRNAMFAKIVRQGIRDGSFRPCDVECLAWNFFGMMSAYILYQPFRAPRGGNGAYSPAVVKRIVNSVLDVFLHGLLRGNAIPPSRSAKGRKLLR